MKSILKTEVFETWRQKINSDLYANAVINSFDYDLANTVGTSFAVLAGNYVDGDTIVSIANTSVTLTASSDNYVVLNCNTAALEKYTTLGAIPVGIKPVIKLYKVTLDEFEDITALVDYRSNIQVDTKKECMILTVGDETTALTTGTGKLTFRMPYAFKLTDVRASVTTAPTDATLNVDINEDAVSVLSTVITIDSTEKTSTTAATPPVISDADLAEDSEITIDIDQIGSTVAGAGLKVYLIGYKV